MSKSFWKKLWPFMLKSTHRAEIKDTVQYTKYKCGRAFRHAVKEKIAAEREKCLKLMGRLHMVAQHGLNKFQWLDEPDSPSFRNEPIPNVRNCEHLRTYNPRELCFSVYFPDYVLGFCPETKMSEKDLEYFLECLFSQIKGALEMSIFMKYTPRR